jgi:hypoxanthine phosphoribosyltransferase
MLLSADEIHRVVRHIGNQVSTDYATSDLAIVSVLKGSFVFTADLVRAITIPLTVDFLQLRSYLGTTESSGVVQIVSDLTTSIEHRDVLVVEDIVDTGLTLDYLLKNLATRNPRSIRVAALLDKPSRRVVQTSIDYVGFPIDDVFVVGYGLDFDEKYRNLPYVGMLEPGA